jgi:general secretion pathway protein M
MTVPLPPILRRVLALVLLLAVPGLIYLGAVMPVRAYYLGLVVEAASLEDALARYEKLGADRPVLAAQLRNAEDQEPDAALYLDGASDALAAARLQELLNAIVREHGGAIDSVRVMESMEEGPYRRVSVQLLIETRIEALRGILHGIETGKPYLFVKTIGIANVSGLRPDSPASEPADLDIRIEVYGYRKGMTS